MEKIDSMVLFGGGSVPYILAGFAYHLNEAYDLDAKWVWNLKDPYFLGWKVDPDSRLAELLTIVFPVPGLSQFDDPEDFDSLDIPTKTAWQFKRILESTGHRFSYEPGMLRGMPVGIEEA